MGEEFSLLQKIEDNYCVEDILDILGLTVEELLKDYLYELVLKHRKDFDIEGADTDVEEYM